MLTNVCLPKARVLARFLEIWVPMVVLLRVILSHSLNHFEPPVLALKHDICDLVLMILMIA